MGILQQCPPAGGALLGDGGGRGILGGTIAVVGVEVV